MNGRQMEGPASAEPTPPISGGGLFWPLIALALAGFAPCILLPDWKKLEVLDAAVQESEHHLSVIQDTLARQKKLHEALRNDPAVITRLAQRDLSLYRRDERPIFVSLPCEIYAEVEPFFPKPLRPPVLVERWASYLPEWDYVGLFCKPRTRIPILMISSGLMAVAFALYYANRTQ